MKLVRLLEPVHIVDDREPFLAPLTYPEGLYVEAALRRAIGAEYLSLLGLAKRVEPVGDTGTADHAACPICGPVIAGDR